MLWSAVGYACHVAFVREKLEVQIRGAESTRGSYEGKPLFFNSFSKANKNEFSLCGTVF